jgi:hypothetical protein
MTRQVKGLFGVLSINTLDDGMTTLLFTGKRHGLFCFGENRTIAVC